MQKWIIFLAGIVTLVVLLLCFTAIVSISQETRVSVCGTIIMSYFVVSIVRILCYLFYAKRDASIMKLFIATRTQQEFDEYKQDLQRQYHVAVKEAEREIAKETAFRC